MKKGISIILSVVLFFLMGLEFVYISASRIATVDFVTDAVDNLDVSSTLNTLKEKNPQVNKAVNELYTQAEKKGYSKQQVDAIMDSDTSKALIENYADSILGEGKELTEDDISQIVTNNADEIIEKSGGKLTEDDKGKIIEAGEAIAPTVVDNLPTKEEVNEMIGTDKINKISNPLESSSFIIVTIVVVVVIALLVFLQWKKSAWLIYTGVPILIDSIITLLFAGLFKVLANVAEGGEDAMFAIAGPLVNTLANVLLIIGIIGVVVFVVEIIVYFVLKNVNKNKVKPKTVKAE